MIAPTLCVAFPRLRSTARRHSIARAGAQRDREGADFDRVAAFYVPHHAHQRVRTVRMASEGSRAARRGQGHAHDRDVERGRWGRRARPANGHPRVARGRGGVALLPRVSHPGANSRERQLNNGRAPSTCTHINKYTILGQCDHVKKYDKP